MLNLAGTSYDFGNVLFAVLQECEHQRRALLPNEAEGRLKEIARAKLAEIHESFAELGGTEAYWRELEREVIETALPQYVPAAIEQTRREKTNYDLWRQADPAARIVFLLVGLVIGGLIWKAPFIPIWDEGIAFVAALAGLLYPEVKKTYFDYHHSRFLNLLIGHAEKYQKNEQLHYVSEARLREEMEEVGGPVQASMPGLHRTEKPAEAGSKGAPRSKSRQ